jgi:hypothetical protein
LRRLDGRLFKLGDYSECVADKSLGRCGVSQIREGAFGGETAYYALYEHAPLQLVNAMNPKTFCPKNPQREIFKREYRIIPDPGQVAFENERFNTPIRSGPGRQYENGPPPTRSHCLVDTL